VELKISEEVAVYVVVGRREIVGVEEDSILPI